MVQHTYFYEKYVGIEDRRSVMKVTGYSLDFRDDAVLGKTTRMKSDTLEGFIE